VTDRHSNAGPIPFSPKPDCLSADVILFIFRYHNQPSVPWCHNQLGSVNFAVELINILECGRRHLDIIRLKRKVGNDVACTAASGSLVYCAMILRAPLQDFP